MDISKLKKWRVVETLKSHVKDDDIKYIMRTEHWDLDLEEYIVFILEEYGYLDDMMFFYMELLNYCTNYIFENYYDEWNKWNYFEKN